MGDELTCPLHGAIHAAMTTITHNRLRRRRFAATAFDRA
jgi:hypothetical protein